MEIYTPEQARRLRNISQKEMAAIIGISENAYIEKEKGNTRFYVDEAFLFCEAVKLPFERVIFLGTKTHKRGT